MQIQLERKKKKVAENREEKKRAAMALEEKKKSCRNPGSNQGPLDLQSNALPAELFRPHTILLYQTK